MLQLGTNKREAFGIPAKGTRVAFKKKRKSPQHGVYDSRPNDGAPNHDYVDTDVYEQPYAAYQELPAGGAIYDELALRRNGNRQRISHDPSSLRNSLNFALCLDADPDSRSRLCGWIARV